MQAGRTVIYLDASVTLAALLAQDRKPAIEFWQGEFGASRLTMYETWNRLFAGAASAEILGEAHSMFQNFYLVDMSHAALARAMEPLPTLPRTLDGLHLATADYLRAQGFSLEFASYDRRLCRAAEAMGLTVAEL